MSLAKSILDSRLLPLLWPFGRWACRRFYRNPVFLVGVGRSGTSALIQALSRHSQLLSGGETHIFQHLGEIMYWFRLSPGASNRQKTFRMPMSVFEERLRRVAFETVFGRGGGLVGAVLAPLRQRYNKTWTARRWVVKAHPTERQAQGLVTLYPSAQFLYMYRNGIDTVASRTKFEGFRKASFEEQCRVWSDSAQQFSYLALWKRALAFSHEEFVGQRDVAFNSIYEFLRLEHEEKPIEFAASTLVHPQGDPTLRGIDVSTVLGTRPAAWSAWSDSERRTFKEICASAMDQLGYQIPFSVTKAGE